MCSPRRICSENALLFRDPVGWEKHRDRLANGFLLRIAEDPLCSRVPGLDDSVEIFRDDGVVRRFNHSSQPRRGSRREFAFRYVFDGEEDDWGNGPTDVINPLPADQHRSLADLWKVVRHGKVLHRRLLRQHLFQQLSEPWNIPLLIPQTVEMPAHGVGL